MTRRGMRTPFGMAVAIAGLSVLAGCGGGGGTVAPPPPPVSVSVIPSQANVKVGAQLPFQAAVQGTSNLAVTWQVNGTTGGTAAVGMIDSTGLYIAPATPPAPPTITITAIAQADTTKSASASVTVTIAITVLPGVASLNLNSAQCPMSQQFIARISGTGNSNVFWTVNGLPAGDPDMNFGTITTQGLYVPPGVIPVPPQFNVTATSQADPTQFSSASVTVSAGGPSVDQLPQSTPIELGTSGGNVNDKSAESCCSGTLGALVMRNGTQFILSNDHILARTDLAQAGEPIGQPGLVDNQCRAGVTIANFSQAVKLKNTGGTTAADAAIAAIVPGQVDASGAILQLGPLNCGLAQPASPASTTIVPAVGMAVAKSGRSTGLTCGTISAVAVDAVQVHYASACGSTSGFVATYDNQVIVDTLGFGSAGDSGSLIVNSDTAEATALLFAGDSTSGVTIANPIQDVLAALPDPSNQALPAIVGGSQHPVAACSGGPGSHARPNPESAMRLPSQTEVSRAKTLKTRYLPSLSADPAVLGVGVGAGDSAGQAAIVVFIERGKAHQPIPESLEGVQVQVKTIGPLRAFDAGCSSRESISPRMMFLRRELP